MITKIEINNHIREFERMLDTYASYKSCLRSLKLNSIMGIKSTLFISEMNPRISIYLNNSSEHTTGYIVDAIFIITDITFIVDDNLYVDEIELNYEISNPKIYEEVKESIEQLKIYPIYSSD